MKVILSENGKINLNRFVEETAEQYVEFLKKQGIAKINDQDEKSRNAFYVRVNSSRAERFVASAKRVDFEGKPMEGFKDMDKKPISEDQFKREVIELLKSTFGFSDELAGAITNNYLDQIKKKL